MKILLVLLDGIGDRSYHSMDDRTPLQSASTPNLDMLASWGSNGLYHASFQGECLPSETAHYLLFGYDLKDFPGRGLLEAVGEGVPFNDRDVLCLAHLAGVEWQGDKPILTLDRDDIKGTGEEIARLLQTISEFENEDIRFRLHQTRRNDAILVLSGEVTPFISDSDPIIKGQPMGKIVPLSDNPEPKEAARTARALNTYLSYCHRKLSDSNSQTKCNLSAANFLATQRCGRRIPQTPFSRFWGLNGMLIASVSVYGGLANELGFEFVSVKDTGDPGKDLSARINMALMNKDHEFFHVHTKLPDEAAHTGDPEYKRQIIEALDRGLYGLVKAVKAREDLLTIITADHSTPSISRMIHSGEPVPVAIVGPNVRRDHVQGFNEIDAGAGCLGFLRGQELMHMILNYADRAVLSGHRMGGIKKPYFPPEFEPFRLV